MACSITQCYKISDPECAFKSCVPVAISVSSLNLKFHELVDDSYSNLTEMNGAFPGSGLASYNSQRIGRLGNRLSCVCKQSSQNLKSGCALFHWHYLMSVANTMHLA